MLVKIIANDKNIPAVKLADAELYFTEGPLEGLKLVGLAVWERGTGGGRNVTFPAGSYSVNGERRSFTLLRPTDEQYGMENQNRVRDLVLQAYQDWEEACETEDHRPGTVAVAGDGTVKGVRA